MLHRLYEVGREPAECTTHHGIVNEMLDKQRLFADHNQPRVILVCFFQYANPNLPNIICHQKQLKFDFFGPSLVKSLGV